MSDEDDFTKLLASAKSGASLESLIPKDIGGADAIQHAEDALDFEEEDELADEEDLPEEETGSQAANDDEEEDWTAAFGKELNGEAEDQDDVDEGAETAESTGKETSNKRKAGIEDVLINVYYPEFVPRTILKMNSFFGPKPSQYVQSTPQGTRACLPTRLRLDAETDQRVLFRSANARIHKIEGVVDVDALDEAENRLGDAPDEENNEKFLKELTLLATDWDYILDNDDDDTETIDGDSPRTEDGLNAGVPPAKKPKLLADVNLVLDVDDIYDSDTENAILEGSYTLNPRKIQIDMNDPYLLFAQHKVEPSRNRIEQGRYNISNDQAYDQLKENYQKKVRSTIGNLTIDHSLVATRLQSPFYRVHLTKAQMRSWHRSRFNVKPGTTMSFSSIKSRKRAKDKGKTITQLLAKSGDLTLGDNAPMFLIEYSEEFPLLLSNTGMGSKLINYYRKRNADDSSRPKLPLGETHVLDVQDRSAFWNFGFVEPGNVVPTLYNQMIRAPIFKHDAKKTDFLLIRSSTKARGQRYFLRSIPYLFVAGQTFPVTQIPGPHSRKVTAASKNRLKMIVHRVLNRSPEQRLQVKDISHHFPDQNDMQNRQRLKEFMEYQRSGADQGFWKVKPGEQVPTEETIRAMIEPEDISLLEAMQVGQQHLQDSGYGKTVDDDKDDQEGMSLEEQLAPWNISRNFINAIQGKAMLQLHGDGDPTARGEGFSFLRTSMKGGFKAAHDASDKVDKAKLGGHSYNVALQQKAYDEEIKRVWYSQAKSLQITDPKKLPAEAPKVMVEPEQTTPAPDADDGFGVGGGSNQKVLRITRLTEDENGIKIRKTEVITDPNVIRAYLIRRRAFEDSQTATRDIVVTNDEDRNRRNKKILEEELARLLRNHDRRMARKATKGEGKVGSKVKSTTRKCATCGAVGHIKTNKSCPMYNDIYMAGQPSTTPAVIPQVAPNLQ